MRLGGERGGEEGARHCREERTPVHDPRRQLPANTGRLSRSVRTLLRGLLAAGWSGIGALQALADERLGACAGS